MWPGLKDMFVQQDPDKIDVTTIKQRFLVTIALEAARTMEEASSPPARRISAPSSASVLPRTLAGAISYIDGLGCEEVRRAG